MRLFRPPPRTPLRYARSFQLDTRVKWTKTSLVACLVFLAIQYTIWWFLRLYLRWKRSIPHSRCRLFQYRYSLYKLKLISQEPAWGRFWFANGIWYGGIGTNFNSDVYMIFIRVYSLDPECGIFLCCSVENLLKFWKNVGLKEFPAILSTPDDMVLMFVCWVV